MAKKSNLGMYLLIGGVGVVGLVVVAARSNNQALSQAVFGNPIARAISRIIDPIAEKQAAKEKAAAAPVPTAAKYARGYASYTGVPYDDDPY